MGVISGGAGASSSGISGGAGYSSPSSAGAGSVLGGAVKGAGAGAAFGPYGMAAGALIGLGTGLYQYNKGKQLERSNIRPLYTPPPQIAQNQMQLDRMAQQGISAPSENKYFQEQQQNAAYGLNQIALRKGGLAGIGNINSQLQEGNYNFMIADAKQIDKNMQAQMAGRQVGADYADQAFQFNQVNPYYEKAAQAQGLMGAGMQNMQTQGSNLLYAGAGGLQVSPSTFRV